MKFTLAFVAALVAASGADVETKSADVAAGVTAGRGDHDEPGNGRPCWRDSYSCSGCQDGGRCAPGCRPTINCYGDIVWISGDIPFKRSDRETDSPIFPDIDTSYSCSGCQDGGSCARGCRPTINSDNEIVWVSGDVTVPRRTRQRYNE